MKRRDYYKIGIVGYGVVGKGIHRLFKNQVSCIIDPAIKLKDVRDFAEKEKIEYNTIIDSFNSDIETDVVYCSVNYKSVLNNVDLIVVSVPTNESETGAADITIVRKVLDDLSSDIIRKGYDDKRPLVLIKSTTPPSFLKEAKDRYKSTLRIVFSPEYMGESKYFTPFWKYADPEKMETHEFQIFGGDPKDTSEIIDIFIRIMGPHVKYYQTDIVTAGLTKYMENSFFAMKVTFCNEWFDIAKSLGVDYNSLRELWLLDSRISPMHTAVFPKDRGYGGKCYPKDTRAIIHEAKQHGYTPELMETMDKVNTKLRG